MKFIRSRAYPFDFLRSRLSQRIVLPVFASIVAIEGLILIPSVIRRHQELLDNLAARSAASLAVAMADVKETNEVVFPEQLVTKLARLEQIPMVVGGAIYSQQGELIGDFGEAPSMTFQMFSTASKPTLLNGSARRYETAQIFPLVGVPHWVVINHNSSSVTREIRAFIWRILGLVLLISVVVTLTTMFVLRSVLIEPILALSQDLLKAAPVALQESQSPVLPFASARYHHRNDELGEVISAFESMFERISNAIARRQQAESQLRESENRFRTLVEQAAESIVLVDETASIVSVNQFGLNKLGYRNEELIGKKIFEINPVFQFENFQTLWKSLQQGQPVTIESLHRRKDGNTFPVEVRTSLITISGQPRVLALVRDISDRKQAEKAQARLAEIGELSAMIVHEVRNPFSTVYMALSSFNGAELSDRSQMRLSLALEEAERLKRLLNEILAYSKEQSIAQEAVNLSALSQDLAESLRESPVVATRNIELIDTVGNAAVKGDRDKLKQVFINLVNNACEAISEQETVTWQIQQASNHLLEIQVRNGGEPIPADVLPKLTQPFVSTKSNGNGLGLAITRRIVEAHGGSLTIESSAEDGTTVTVHLPACSL